MLGNFTVIEKLNDLLSDELTSINQYMVHAGMCKNWGLHKLHDEIEKRAVGEMHHAEKLIARILFLEGIPVVSVLKPIFIGANVPEMIASDYQAELGAVSSYNHGIKLCADFGDNGTRDMLESYLEDEECHVDWSEAQMDKISQMGIENYLSTQV
jgi:bacterioferritin